MKCYYVVFYPDAELSTLRECDVSKMTKELEREKIKRRQLEIKLKKAKRDEDSATKLRSLHVYY